MEITTAIVSEQLEQAKKEMADASEKRVKELSSQMAELIRKNQEFKRLEEERELEIAKKIAFAEDKVRKDAQNKAKEETDLKVLEKEKTISDLQKKLEEMQKTAQQGSQQTQGEVLELQLEQSLKQEFPNDIISEVPKGVRGADIIQEVHDKNGRTCGTIVWESKNAKWNANWIAKLKDDQREVNADMAVLLTVDLPKEYKPFTFQSQVYITGRDSAVAVAKILRLALYEVFKVKQSGTDKQDKKEYLYEYVNSKEFLSKMESLVETFSIMKDEIENEKGWFSRKWARQEKQLTKALDSANSFYGDVQGITGNTLPEIKSLES